MDVNFTYSLPVSVKGQVTIPVAIRKLLGLDKTKSVRLEVVSRDKVLIKPVELTLEQVYGSVKPIKKSFKEMRKIVREERVK